MIPKKRFNLPYLGFGIGLRPQHYQDLLHHPIQVDWLEIISENFLLDGGLSLHYLDLFKDHYTLVPHGVSLSIGSTSELSESYLKKLKALVEKLQAPWFSDHLCWGNHKGKNFHNLMPLPYTPEVINYVADRIKQVQNFIGKPFLLENVSSYIEFTESKLPEWDFIAQIAEKADCGILLDINNVYVSSRNHNFDPLIYLKNIPSERVIQYHMAGHDDKGTYVLDSHDHPVRDEVWALYQQAIPLFGEVSFMIERDDHIPPLNELLAEVEYAKQLYAKTKS